MTSINLAVQPKRRAAYIISDCAWTRPDGTLFKVAGKIIAFERFPCAIGVTGNIDLLALGEECHAIDARNLATLVKALPSVMRRAMKKTTDTFPDTPGVLATIKIAAWSARKGRPVGFMATSDDALARVIISPEFGAFEVAEVRDSHGTDVHVSELLGRTCDLTNADTFDPHQDSFALIAAQRGRPQFLTTPGCDPAARYRIGGEVELTEVTRRGVRVFSCGTFPDTVGEMITV